MIDNLDLSFMQGAGIALAITLVGVIATSWSKVKGFLGRLYSRIIVTVSVEHQVGDAVCAYLMSSRFKKSKFGSRVYSGFCTFVRPKKRSELIAFEMIGTSAAVFREGLKIIWISHVENKEGNRSGIKKFKFFRGTFNQDNFIQDAVDYWNNMTRGLEGNRSGRYLIRRIFGKSFVRRGEAIEIEKDSDSSHPENTLMFSSRMIKWKLDDLGPSLNDKSPIDELALQDNVLEAIQEAKVWINNKDWFIGRGIPWRRGWLMTGNPGTGKTATARAIAEEFDLPVFIYDLASLTNGEFLQEWTKMLGHTPCMALIEDIDAVFNGRRNVAVGDNETGLTFDTLINALDGVERADGLFTVITTNRVGVLDPALGVPNAKDGKSTRPGRVDRIVEMKELDEEGRYKLAKRILKEWPETWDEIVQKYEGTSGAVFQEACCELAIKLFWKDKNMRSKDENIKIQNRTWL